MFSNIHGLFGLIVVEDEKTLNWELNLVKFLDEALAVENIIFICCLAEDII
jgi:hypothetical protein